MKKHIFLFVIILLFSLTYKKNKVYYIPFDIPGSQMAATIPPFGTFIESKYKNSKPILRHEMVHWVQYSRMGFLSFYITYFSEYIKYGRKYGPMEIEARKLTNK
jgi:hypothetical protein